MANTKEYRILINGVQEATNNVTSLKDALDKLGGASIKDAAKGLDDLGKAEKKIAEYDVEYQKALAATKAELKEKNKAVKDAIDLETANKTVLDNQRETYAEKQRLLTALGKVIRNMTTDTKEDIEKQAQLKQQYADLNQELKDFDATMGNHQRNVGDYRGALKEATAELKNLKGEMMNYEQGSEMFNKLAEEAGVLEDKIGDINAAIKRQASDTKTLDDTINLAKTATSVFELYKGTMSMLGVETKGAEEAMQQLLGAMSVIYSLQ